MDRNMRNQHPMMSSNMSKRHVSSHHQQHQQQQQSHHSQQHSQSMSHSMMVQNRERDQIQPNHQHHYHQQPQSQQQQPQHHNVSTAGMQQNEDLIKYIEDAWHKVTSDHGPHSGAKYYSNAAEPPVNFEPFDLEGYWGRRMVQNLHLSRNHQ